MTKLHANALYLSTAVILSVCLLEATGTNFFHFHPGYALIGNAIITTEITTSWDECVKSCLARSKCLSIEMETRFRLCRIFSTDTLSGGAELKRSPGVWYSEKKDWTKTTIDQRCLGECFPFETCFIRETATCQITGSEVSVGSKVLHTCLDDRDMSSVSICGIDGQWTLEDFTCPTVFACPDGWEMFQDSCYLFVDSCKSFTNAENNCRSLDARLVHVESGEENTFLRSYLSGLPMADYWIGMTDEDQEGNWKWYGNGVDVQFFDWKPGEASSNRHENCAVFGDTISYTWADVACGSRRKSVCEMTNPE